MYRRRLREVEIFLVHPGGPYFAKKNLGAWTIPKGEYLEDEEPLQAARREFQEETGFASSEPFFYLGSVKQAGGKVVSAWAFEGDCDPGGLKSNTFELEWPPRSGRLMEIPEVDRGQWFSVAAAKEHIKSSQAPLIDRLLLILNPAE